MPWKKKRITKKRTFKKRSLAKMESPKTLVNMGLGFPRRLITKLRYTEAFNLAPAASAYAYNDFCANGLYDPNLETGGHQPMYFDQYIAIYNHYKVLGSRITIRMTPKATAEDPCFIGVYLNDDDTHTPADIQSYQELSGIGCHRMTPPGMASVYQLSCNYSSKKTFGLLKTDALIGTAAANPTETQVFTVYAYPVGNAGVDFYVQATVEYIVEFFELKDISGS